LYRIVTTEGHVKWVCIDHFRENYHEKAAKAFRETLEVLQGKFDENIGRVEVTLRSRVQAEQFYAALEGARSVYELKLHFGWDTTQSDFKRLRTTLPKTCVGVLELNLGSKEGPTSDILNRGRRYDPIFGIMRHPSIQSFSIRGPYNLSKRCNLHSRKNEFPNLRHLDISLHELQEDLSSAMYLMSKASNLSSLAIDTGGYGMQYALQACNVIKGRRTYTFDFKDWSLRIPPPPKESNQAMDIQQCKEDLLRIYWENGNEVLDVDYLNESITGIFAQATTNGMGYKELYLRRDGQLGNSFVNSISTIAALSELNFIDIYMKEEEERVRILESIQLEHVRTLLIRLKAGTFEPSVMRALVDGMKKVSGKVEMDRFWLVTETDALLSLPKGDLLRDFVASTLIKKQLVLDVDMSLEQMLSLFRSADFSRLEYLRLWTKGFDSAKVETILDGLQHATNLTYLNLLQADITVGQKERMGAKGVFLDSERRLLAL
jgi:hypothetical protein